MEHGIDNARFGAFVAALRKENGWTQKQLAEQIGVSDKAVSKWERGLSLPDIALLEPLAGALGVTVAELLHGERLSTPVSPQTVDELVTGAVRLGSAGFHSDPVRRLRWIGWLAAGLLVLGGELLVASYMTGQPLAQLLADPAAGTGGLAPLIAAGAALMLCFLPDTLPEYYDQYKVDCLVYGPVHLHLPGVRFNNRNWPYVKRAGFAAMLVLLVGFFPLVQLLGFLLPALPWQLYLVLLLGAVLGGLFIPMIVAAVRHSGVPGAGRTALLVCLGVAALVAVIAVAGLALGATVSSGFRMNFRQQKSLSAWRAQYDYYSGVGSGRLQGEGALDLAVETDAGQLTITVTDRDGDVLLDETTAADAAWQIKDPGPVKVTVRADEHRGGFAVAFDGAE